MAGEELVTGRVGHRAVRRRARLAVAAALVVAGGSAGTAWAAYTATTENPGNSISAPDLSPPTISRATVARVGGEATAGTIRRRAQFYYYAQVEDQGQPPSGTANVTTAGLAATAGGPHTVGGSTYNWRSPVQTGTAASTPGSDSAYAVQATDAVGYGASLTGLLAHVESYGEVVGATSGLRNHWRLAETTGTAAADVTGNGAGTYIGSPATRGVTGALDGDANRAAQFDGTDDAVNVPRQIADDFSVEFWFKTANGSGSNATWSGNAGLVDGSVAGTANDFGVSIRADGRITFGVGNPDQTGTTAAGTAYDDNAWHHVVFTRERTSGTLRLYVDGVQQISGAATNRNSLTAPPRLRIGGIQTGAPWLNGQVDEVATYTSVMPAATVTDHYAIGKGTG